MSESKIVPPKAIWLQFYGEERKKEFYLDPTPLTDRDVSWCVDKIYQDDVRYIIDKRHKRRAAK